ncbi:protein kinase domain-containing protein [Streptomyces sp. NPDC001970]
MSWQGETTPSAVGEYHIERRIGAGGMGVVYLAVSPSGRRVALKVIRAEFAGDADYRARFRHEIEAARQVSGAFTAPVVGADADCDPPWMATQYFDAPTLSERVQGSGPFDEDGVWRLGRGLAEALRDIHRAGLVHRDLKPSNVLLTEDGPRVIDFGIARVLNAERLTQTGTILGTVSFMAPEQLSSPRDVGAAADVFALGGLLTYAATGRGPFVGDTGAPPIAIAMNIAQDEPDLTAVPSALHSVIEQCLCKDPAGRPSPTELLAVLQAKGAAAAGPEKSRAMPGPVGLAHRSRLRSRTRTYMLGAVAVIAVAVAVPITQRGAAGGDRADARDSATPSAPASPSAASVAAAPAVEPMAAVRPKGWALWEKKPTTAAESFGGARPACAGSGDVLVCSEAGVVAERIDAASGRVMWSKRHTQETSTSSVVGFAGQTALVQDFTRDQLVGFDVKTGHRLWSAQASGQPAGTTVQESTVTMVHPHVDGSRIDRRDARTGKLLVSRTFPAGAWPYVFEGGDGVLHVLKTGGDKGYVTSLAVLDTATLRTTTLATFDEDPGTPVAADRDTVSFLLDGKSITHVTRADGHVQRVPLQNAQLGVPYAEDGTLYISRTDGTLASYDLRTGRRHWAAETQGESPGRPVLADGHLYSLASDGRITRIDPATGKILWRSAARRDPNWSLRPIGDPNGPNQTPPVVLNGVVYAGSTTGSIFAIARPTA